MAPLGGGNDDRCEHVVNLGTLEFLRRFARIWHAHDWHITRLHETLTAVNVRQIEMPADLFGAVAGMRDARSDRRWYIRLNDRLPIVAANATLGHEYGHTFQAIGRQANCQPYGELPALEQEAHAAGAILTVPADALAGLTLGDTVATSRIAVDLQVPVTYVVIRNSLAVFLGEKQGHRGDASAYLNHAMMAHQVWMSRIADFMSATAE